MAAKSGTYVCTLSAEMLQKAKKELNEDPNTRLIEIKTLRERLEKVPVELVTTDAKLSSARTVGKGVRCYVCGGWFGWPAPAPAAPTGGEEPGGTQPSQPSRWAELKKATVESRAENSSSPTPDAPNTQEKLSKDVPGETVSCEQT